jgi:hypothetical protein
VTEVQVPDVYRVSSNAPAHRSLRLSAIVRNLVAALSLRAVAVA